MLVQPRSGDDGRLKSRSSTGKQVLNRHFDIAENGSHKTRTNDLSRVYRYRCGPSVLMFQKDVATSGSYDLKSSLFEQAYNFLTPSDAVAESYRDLLDPDEF
jgi:hypothetical protein